MKLRQFDARVMHRTSGFQDRDLPVMCQSSAKAPTVTFAVHYKSSTVLFDSQASKCLMLDETDNSAAAHWGMVARVP